MRKGSNKSAITRSTTRNEYWSHDNVWMSQMTSIMRTNRVNAWKLDTQRTNSLLELKQTASWCRYSKSDSQSFAAVERSAVGRLFADARPRVKVEVDVAQHEEDARWKEEWQRQPTCGYCKTFHEFSRVRNFLFIFSIFFFQSSFVTDFIPREERVARSDGLARFDVDEEVNDEGEAHYAHRRAPRVKWVK